MAKIQPHIRKRAALHKQVHKAWAKDQNFQALSPRQKFVHVAAQVTAKLKTDRAK